ncbi:hypothetical protein ACW582_03485 [Pseudomonas chlororaphis]
MPIDQTQLILLRKYQPDSPLLQPLQGPACLDKGEELPAIKKVNNASPEGSQEVVDNISPVTKALLRIIQKLHKKESDGKN